MSCCVPSSIPGRTTSDQTKALSRRSAVLTSFALPLASFAPAKATLVDRGVLEAEVAGLVARADRANAAFMRGDMDAWHRLAAPIAEDFTLMQPFGGRATRGFDASPERLAAMARYFTGGEAELEIVATYASADMAGLVFVERQRGRVGGLADQDWSLRVTQIYRRCGTAWELIHRHADPLVRNFGLEKSAALARGD